MQVFVPIDGSECSFTALRFATDFAAQYDADVDVVHFVEQEADKNRDEVREISDRAQTILEEASIRNDPEIITDIWITPYRYANRIGKDILRLVDERGYDHVIMGHHGTGAVGRVLLGSAAETVVRSAPVPVTVIP